MFTCVSIWQYSVILRSRILVSDLTFLPECFWACVFFQSHFFPWTFVLFLFTFSQSSLWLCVNMCVNRLFKSKGRSPFPELDLSECVWDTSKVSVCVLFVSVYRLLCHLASRLQALYRLLHHQQAACIPQLLCHCVEERRGERGALMSVSNQPPLFLPSFSISISISPSL